MPLDAPLAHATLSDEARDELVVLASMYPDHVRAGPSSPPASLPSVDLILELPSLADTKLHPTVRIALPPDYPQSSPPRVLSAPHAPLWSPDMLAHLRERAVEMWSIAPGEVVVFEWVEWATEYLDGCIAPIAAAMAATSATAGSVSLLSSENKQLDDDASESSMPDLAIAPTPFIERLFSHDDPILDRKSVFLAHAAYITSPTRDPPALLAYLVSHRRIARATHNITAYRLVTTNETTGAEAVVQDCDDDGEDAAGKRLLHLLQLIGARNVWVCVTRWYGGVQLGPDRFAHINNVARRALVGMGAVPGEGVAAVTKPAATSDTGKRLRASGKKR
ncbi:ribosomal protein S5 domain 2-type protein [Blastocladiella britannica]|nr:ribosomal protein S5 domain 2-type protein [Blastocladiella britannica]